MMNKTIQSGHVEDHNNRQLTNKFSPYRKYIYIFLASLIFVINSSAYAVETVKAVDNKRWLLDKPLDIPMLIVNKSISVSDIPNPHLMRQEGCATCHTNRGKVTGKVNKKINKTCTACHSAISSHEFIHPSDLYPSPEMKKSMQRIFQKQSIREGGKVSCTVCHDMAIQCIDKRKSERGLNPMLLRGGPYTARSDVCYSCHNKKAYQRLNPHDQIDKKGKLKLDKCVLCHKDISKLADAKSIADVDFIVTNGLSNMCTGCHKVKSHPGGSFNFAFSGRSAKGPNHLVTPPARVRNTIKKMSKKTGITMPLDPKTNQVFCGTCHNPHQKGVIKVAESAHGADERFRLRKQDICGQCHDF